MSFELKFFVCRHVSMWGFRNRICPHPEKRNHPGFVNISPTLVIIDASIERFWRVLQHGNPKSRFFFKKKLKIEFCPYPEKRNRSGIVNISVTLVIDTSMKMSSRVLQHGNPKNWNWILNCILTCAKELKSFK